jgi:filamentous hemagglutinin family protein
MARLWLQATPGTVIILAIAVLFGSRHSILFAQTTNITSSGLNTRVANPSTNPSITGGTRPGGAAGTNLFHSFGEFNIGANNVASFLNSGSVDLAGNSLPSGLATSNIFSRVTGGSPSNIFGTIDTMNFGTANLYLINPAGILFGPTAQLNVGGAFTASTADYLKMTDGAKFYANPSQSTVLSIAPLAAFGFLGTNPGGTITLQGTTTPPVGLFPTISRIPTLVGRDLTVGGVTTPGIDITNTVITNHLAAFDLISVGQPTDPIRGAEVNVTAGPIPTDCCGPFRPFLYSFSGFGSGGNVRISGNLIADNVVILTPPTGAVTIANASASSDGIASIDINTGTLQIDGTLTSGGLVNGPINLTAASSVMLNGTISNGAGSVIAGSINITSPSVFLSRNAVINTEGAGDNSGFVTLNVGTLELSNGSLIGSGSRGGAAGGLITIQGLDGAGTSASSVNIAGKVSSEVGFGAGPSGGGIVVNAQNVSLQSSGLISSADVSPSLGIDPGTGPGAGSVTVTASGVFQSSGGALTSTTVDGRGGDITIQAGGISLTNGATLSASSSGTGSAGSIQLTSGGDITVRNSHIQTSSTQASGGDIKLTAPNLVRVVDSTVTSSVQGEAGSNGGNINIDPQVVVIQNSSLLANANAGAGGNINIAALGAVLVDPNSVIDASAGPAGISGSVSINSPIQVLSGALVPMKLAYTQTGLSGDRCAADPKGQFSSFVQTGRDGAPQSPGGLASSPLGFLDTFQTSFLDTQGLMTQTARLGLSELLGETTKTVRFFSGCRS